MNREISALVKNRHIMNSSGFRRSNPVETLSQTRLEADIRLLEPNFSLISKKTR